MWAELQSCLIGHNTGFKNDDPYHPCKSVSDLFQPFLAWDCESDLMPTRLLAVLA